MAAPGPMIRVLLATLDQRSGLRIMNDHEFSVERKPRAVTVVAGEKNFKILRLRVIRSAMQRVVKRFRHAVKVVSTGHDVPAHIQLEFLRERQEAVQNLCHTSTDSGRVDHLYAAPSQGLREYAQFVDLALA